MDGTVLTMLAKEQLPLTWNPKDLYILEAAENYLVVPKVRENSLIRASMCILLKKCGELAFTKTLFPLL